jgi:hypothetical protein
MHVQLAQYWVKITIVINVNTVVSQLDGDGAEVG